MNLYELCDEKTDVYKENERFDSLLKSYYESKDPSFLSELSLIIFKCSCNVLKKKYGYFQSKEWIIENAVDMTILITGRITNREKYPNGYVIKNLPSVVRFAVMNVVYTKKEEIIQWSDKVSTAVDYKTLEYYEYSKYNHMTEEDRILDRMEEKEQCRNY